MTTSRQPWTANGNVIKDASGNNIGVMVDARDADYIIGLLNVKEELENASEKLTEIESVLKGEY